MKADCFFLLQDVLVVTAPGSGAEIIPFLKTWVNLPMAIGFTVLYAKVRNNVASCFELYARVVVYRKVSGCIWQSW